MSEKTKELSGYKVAIGETEDGNEVVLDLYNTPHILICGVSGSGKSSLVRDIIIKLMNNDVNAQFIICDRKLVEYTEYGSAPHMLLPRISDPQRVSGVVCWVIKEIRDRLEVLAQLGYKNIDAYNEGCNNNSLKKMSSIYVIIDDFSTLYFWDKDVCDSLIYAISNGRCVGIHFIIVSATVLGKSVSKELLSTISCRIGFRVISNQESKVLLGQRGAEVLSVPGEMIVQTLDGMITCKSTPMSDELIKAAIDKLPKDVEESTIDGTSLREAFDQLYGETFEQEDTSLYDDLLAEAGRLVLLRDYVTIGYLQRNLRLGFARAAHIYDQLKELGLIGEENKMNVRPVLMSSDEWEDVVSSKLS